MSRALPEVDVDLGESATVLSASVLSCSFLARVRSATVLQLGSWSVTACSKESGGGGNFLRNSTSFDSFSTFALFNCSSKVRTFLTSWEAPMLWKLRS